MITHWKSMLDQMKSVFQTHIIFLTLYFYVQIIYINCILVHCIVYLSTTSLYNPKRCPITVIMHCSFSQLCIYVFIIIILAFGYYFYFGLLYFFQYFQHKVDTLSFWTVWWQWYRLRCIPLAPLCVCAWTQLCVTLNVVWGVEK